MSLINIIVLSFKLLVDCWDVFVYGRGWPHASQVCCDTGARCRANFPELKQQDTKTQVEKFKQHFSLFILSSKIRQITWCWMATIQRAFCEKVHRRSGKQFSQLKLYVENHSMKQPPLSSFPYADIIKKIQYLFRSHNSTGWLETE